MSKKIVLIGKSCSGKTELAYTLKTRGFKPAVTCTTRPIRINEKEGVHYYFKSREEFQDMMVQDQLVEWDEFNDWFYGLPKSEFENADVLVVTPRGLTKLIEKFGRESMSIIYLDTLDVKRLYRSQLRGDDMNEVQRRFKTDEADFAKFHASGDWDLRLDIRVEDNYELVYRLFSQNPKTI